MIQLREDRISDLVDALPQSLLQKAPKTHFPIQLPLAFPSDLHHINLLTVLHLVYTTISRPQHLLYLAETKSDAHDLTIRGVFGLFLASDESWGPQNLLSSKAWKQGVMDEAKVGEFFGLDIMREKDHPTLPVKIGERWKPGVELAGDLVGLFKRLGEKLPMRCVGEAVLAALGHSDEESKGQRANLRSAIYARAFCGKVIGFERSMADSYPAPSGGEVIPAAPLRLLQDLTALLPLLPDTKITIPKTDDVSHQSPLPISLILLLSLDLLDLRESKIAAADIDKIVAVYLDSTESIHVLLAPLLSKQEVTPGSTVPPSTISISLETYNALQTVSVEVCRHIWGAARFSRSDGAEGEWKHELSFLDVERMCSELEKAARHQNQDVVLVAAPDG